MTLTLTTPQECASALAPIRTILFDCDGVLWIWRDGAMHVIPGAMKALAALREAGKKLIFVSNRASYSAQGFSEMFQSFGFSVPPEDIFCSSRLATLYLSQHLPRGKAVISISFPAFDKILADAGIRVYNGLEKPQCEEHKLSVTEMYDPKHSEEIGAVILADSGVHSRMEAEDFPLTIEFLKSHPEIPLIIANPDATFNSGDPLKGTWERHTFFTEAGRREGVVALGKPMGLGLGLIREKHELDLDTTLVVGDNVYSDIKFGSDNGIKTLLVHSGCRNPPERIEEIPPTYQACHVPWVVAKGLGREQVLGDGVEVREFLERYKLE